MRGVITFIWVYVCNRKHFINNSSKVATGLTIINYLCDYLNVPSYISVASCFLYMYLHTYILGLNVLNGAV